MVGAAAFCERGIYLWHPDSLEDVNWGSMSPSVDFGQFITHNRFKQFKQFVVPSIWESENLKLAGDLWWRFATGVDEFNKIRSGCILTSKDQVLDESMSSPYCPCTIRLGGLPNISYIFQKPELLWVEFKSTVCTMIKMLMHLEIQQGKEGMRTMEFNSSFGAAAGCTLRMAKALIQSKIDGIIERVMGDAWFVLNTYHCSFLYCHFHHPRLVTNEVQNLFQWQG